MTADNPAENQCDRGNPAENLCDRGQSSGEPVRLGTIQRRTCVTGDNPAENLCDWGQSSGEPV